MKSFRSNLTGIAWPALLDRPAAQLGSILYQLEQSQWLSPEELAAVRRPQLEALLAHASSTVSYYRKKFAAAGLPSGGAELADAWSEIPILARSDLQDAGRTIFTSALPKAHGQAHPVQTSGSTGKPVTALSTGVTQLFWNAHAIREHLWRGRDLTGKLAAIRPDRKVAKGGVESATWGPPVDQLFATGPSALLHSTTPIDEQVRWLERQQPAYLLSLPANLTALAEAFRAEGKSLPGLREIRSYGETVTPKLRRLVEDAWGVPVTDVYSAQEVGYIAMQCREADSYHLQCEHLLVEILGETGDPCGPGEIGRIVVTTLLNFASPLIRYELGDHAEVGERCGCGRGLPVIRRVLGRERNLVTLPDGRRHWPSFPEHDWMTIAPIRQLQLLQKTPREIEARIVAPRELTGDEKQRLGKVLAASLGYPFEFSFSYHEQIPRAKNGKFEDFVSEVARDIA